MSNAAVDAERASAAIFALDTCVEAHLAGELGIAARAMETVLALVHCDGDYAARHRLAFLAFALTEEISLKHGGGVWAIRRTATDGSNFDDEPEGVRLAHLAVVAFLNGETLRAAEVITELANATDGSTRLAEMLGALVAIHTQTHRGPWPRWLGAY